jgi:outer membrane biosynthesis protein TonB
VQEQIQENAVITVQYLRDERPFLDVAFDTATLRQALDSKGSDAIEQMVASWEPCTASQRAQAQAFVAGQSADFPYCKPADSQLMEERLKRSKETLIGALPERFVLREELQAFHDEPQTEIDQQLDEVRKVFLFADRMMALNVLVPVMLFSLLVMAAVRSAKGCFLWVGLTLIGSGLLTFAPLLAWLSNLLNPQETVTAETLDGLALEAFLEFQRSLAQELGGAVAGVAALMLIAGIVAIVIAALLKGPQEEPEQQLYYLAPAPVVPQAAAPQAQPTVTPPPQPTPSPAPRPATPPPAPPPSPVAPASPPGPSVAPQVAAPSPVAPPQPTTDSQAPAELVDVDLANDNTLIPTDGPLPMEDEEKDSSTDQGES